jgi:tetratricopeptide (TPR) repeat protein
MRGPLSSPSRRTLFVVPALLALLLSLPAVQGPLLWDDGMLITGDRFTHHLANIPAAFGRTFWEGVECSATRFDYYRPLVTVTYILNYAVADGWSGPYHLVNSALYAGTAGLLALTVAELGAGAGVALAAGLLFAAWPPHNENVDFVSGRTDLLAGLFLLLALLEYHRLRRRDRPSPAGLARLALWVAAAAFSKEVAYVAPVAFLLYEWAAATRAPRSPAWPRLLAVTLPVALALGSRMLVMAGRGSAPMASPQIVFSALMVNTRVLLCPWPLYINLRFGPENFIHPPLPFVIIWVLGAALPLWLLRGRPERAAWLAVWLVTIPGGAIGAPANRMLYLSSMVLLPLLSWKLSRLPWSAGLKAGLCVAALALGSTGFVVAGHSWSDDVLLLERLVRESPPDFESRETLADRYYGHAVRPGVADSTRLRLLEQSARQSRRALALNGKSSHSWMALARASFELGRDEMSLHAANRMLGLAPASSEGHFLKAQALTRLGRYAEADTAAGTALLSRAGLNNAEYWALLGWIRFKRGRYGESSRLSEHALLLSPAHPVAGYNRALAQGCAGQADSAEAGYRLAMSYDPDGSGAEAALADIAEHGAAGGPHGETAATAFLGAAGLLPGSRGSLPEGCMPRLRAALATAARTWPALARLSGAGGTE